MKQFIIKNLLKFVKYKTKKFEAGLGCTCVASWKELFGKKYLYSVMVLPPEHPNCKCSIVKIN